jgi:hypothetical protein
VTAPADTALPGEGRAAALPILKVDLTRCATRVSIDERL